MILPFVVGLIAIHQIAGHEIFIPRAGIRIPRVENIKAALRPSRKPTVVIHRIARVIDIIGLFRSNPLAWRMMNLVVKDVDVRGIHRWAYILILHNADAVCIEFADVPKRIRILIG